MGGSRPSVQGPERGSIITCVTERLVLLLPRHRRHGHHIRRVHHPHVHVQRHVRGHRLNADRGGCAGRRRRRRGGTGGGFQLEARRWRRGGPFCQWDDCLEEGLQRHSRRRWKRRNSFNSFSAQTAVIASLTALLRTGGSASFAVHCGGASGSGKSGGNGDDWQVAAAAVQGPTALT